MMRAITILSMLGSTSASPAVVWQKVVSAEGTLRTSKELKAHNLFSDLLSKEVPESSLSSVIFLLGRGADGSESLSTLAAAGVLPNVQVKYGGANAIHHHVSGVESVNSVVLDASHATGSGVLSITLGELDKRLDATAHRSPEEMEVSLTGVVSKHSPKRAQALANAKVLIVQVDPNSDGDKLDAAVAKAIDNDAVVSVVLTAVRSHEEVKQERLSESRRRLSLMKAATPNNSGRRRLEEAQAEGDGQEQNYEDMTGVYYVSMTPNILAGILFGLLFAFIAFTGVSCMGMISGQDVYVKKMPPVGREA